MTDPQKLSGVVIVSAGVLICAVLFVLACLCPDDHDIDEDS